MHDVLHTECLSRLPSMVIRSTSPWHMTHSSLWEGKESQCGPWPCRYWAQLCMGLGTRKVPSSRTGMYSTWEALQLVKEERDKEEVNRDRAYHGKASRAKHVQAFAWPVGQSYQNPWAVELQETTYHFLRSNYSRSILDSLLSFCIFGSQVSLSHNALPMAPCPLGLWNWVIKRKRWLVQEKGGGLPCPPQMTPQGWDGTQE